MLSSEFSSHHVALVKRIRLMGEKGISAKSSAVDLVRGGDNDRKSSW